MNGIFRLILLAILIFSSMMIITSCQEISNEPDNDMIPGYEHEPGDTPGPAPTTELTSTPEPNGGNTPGLPMRGTWNGNVYTSEYLGFSITVPDNWEIATDEMLALQQGLPEATISDFPDGKIPYDFWDAWDRYIFQEIWASISSRSPEIINQTIRLYFEKLEPENANITGPEYINLQKEEAGQSGLFKFDFSKSDTPVKIGNNDWYLIIMEMVMGQEDITYVYRLISIRDGFLVILLMDSKDSINYVEEMMNWIT